MRTRILPSLIFFSFFSFYSSIQSQNNETPKKSKSVHTLRDIPHKTPFEKWMWIHRCAAFIVTKERPMNYDTTYIKSYYKRLVITLPISTRFLRFSLVDFNSGNRLNFTPNLQSDLGIGISSSFILNSGVKVFHLDNDIKGETTYKDIQVNIYLRRVTTDMFIQSYSGFYIRNSRDFKNYTSKDPYSVRSDVSATHLGVSSYYIFNHKKFSYGGSFSFIEQQKKSAGSLLGGAYYSYFGTNSSPSLVTDSFRSSFDSLSYIQQGHTQNFGINLGIIYTLKFFKKCNATASFTQGVGASKVNYIREDLSSYAKLIPQGGKLNIRFLEEGIRILISVTEN
jgi:hypothetical protein